MANFPYTLGPLTPAPVPVQGPPMRANPAVPVPISAPPSAMGGTQPSPVTPPGAGGGASGFFSQLMQRIQSDPQLRENILRAGTTMMQPRAPGQSQAGQFGLGVNSFLDSQTAQDKEALEKQKAEALIKESGSRTREADNRVNAEQSNRPINRERIQSEIALNTARTGEVVAGGQREAEMDPYRQAYINAQTNKLLQDIEQAKTGTGEQKVLNSLSVMMQKADPSMDANAATVEAAKLWHAFKNLKSPEDFAAAVDQQLASSMAAASLVPQTLEQLQNIRESLIAAYNKRHEEVSGQFNRLTTSTPGSTIPPGVSGIPDAKKNEGRTAKYKGQVVKAINGQWVFQ